MPIVTEKFQNLFKASAIGACRVFLHAQSLGMPHCVGDLVSPDHCEEVVGSAISEFGQLHGLINNAGAVLRNLIEETDANFWDMVMNVNARAPLLLIREALEYLSASRGHVVNIGSVNAYSGEPNLLAYSASKGALMTMTRNLGDTLHRDHGIKVPGGTGRVRGTPYRLPYEPGHHSGN